MEASYKKKTKEKSKNRNKKNRAYRKFKIYYNLIFGAFVIFILVFGLFHVFTKKKAFRNEGIKQFENGEYEAAIESFNSALKCNQWFSDNVNVDIEMYKADSYIKLTDFASAKRVYSQIKSKYPEKYYDKDKVDFLIELTDALDRYKYGDYVSTVACFNRAVEAGYVEMSIYAADCYEKSHDYEKMKNNLDIYTTSYGYTPEICYKYASYYIANEDYNSALICIEQGIACGESIYTQEFLYAQILCYSKAGNYEKAYELSTGYKERYPEDTKGADIYAYLDTRVNPDKEVVNDIFNQNDKIDEEAIEDTIDENEENDAE